MEKYREVKWNKEIEVERRRNAEKTKDSKPDNNNFNNLDNNEKSIKLGKLNVKAACRLVVLIALGTMLGNLISYFGYKYITKNNVYQCEQESKITVTESGKH
ncbi:hypothetical protein [Methylobacter sp.]|uniref:hypothetical protein n=1 Tax=Methylobacter sp. TaxID=2051955 RepID=UPI0024895B16|nr:hypothetical protein [Methylobacter sp.]MDI1279521.1 hypothetical protein [Methylobacter sp.]MDI1360270.1 hypothetical protein [Methylobacter sp.]